MSSSCLYLRRFVAVAIIIKVIITTGNDRMMFCKQLCVGSEFASYQGDSF